MLLLSAAILASLIPGAWSQDLRTATLVGIVTDSSGATVANASVIVTNIDTQLVARSKTNDTGAYYLTFLNIGNYRLVIEAPGFNKFDQTGIILQAGETPASTSSSRSAR